MRAAPVLLVRECQIITFTFSNNSKYMFYGQTTSFAYYFRASGVSYEYTGLFSHSKNMHCRLIDVPKLSVVCD